MAVGVLVVTGGGRGIGAATARRAAQAGWSVCLSYRADQEAAEALAEELHGLGVTARAVRADMSSEADIVGLFAAATELGRVAGLVANAGVVAPQGRIDEIDAARVRHLLEVNVAAPMLCCREAVRRMSTRHGGRGGSIVLISS
ncbi:MAG: SDR family NAD(P)-dependent oxidoreductase, partial [Propionibacteriaceae bacterium]